MNHVGENNIFHDVFFFLLFPKNRCKIQRFTCVCTFFFSIAFNSMWRLLQYCIRVVPTSSMCLAVLVSASYLSVLWRISAIVILRGGSMPPTSEVLGKSAESWVTSVWEITSRSLGKR